VLVVKFSLASSKDSLNSPSLLVSLLLAAVSLSVDSFNADLVLLYSSLALDSADYVSDTNLAKSDLIASRRPMIPPSPPRPVYSPSKPADCCSSYIPFDFCCNKDGF